MQALREILMNAMEHGAAFNPEQVMEVTAVRTARAMVFYVRDPGAGFRRESLTPRGYCKSIRRSRRPYPATRSSRNAPRRMRIRSSPGHWYRG